MIEHIDPLTELLRATNGSATPDVTFNADVDRTLDRLTAIRALLKWDATESTGIDVLNERDNLQQEVVEIFMPIIRRLCAAELITIHLDLTNQQTDEYRSLLPTPRLCTTTAICGSRQLKTVAEWRERSTLTIFRPRARPNNEDHHL